MSERSESTVRDEYARQLGENNGRAPVTLDLFDFGSEILDDLSNEQLVQLKAIVQRLFLTEMALQSTEVAARQAKADGEALGFVAVQNARDVKELAEIVALHELVGEATEDVLSQIQLTVFKIQQQYETAVEIAAETDNKYEELVREVRKLVTSAFWIADRHLSAESNYFSRLRRLVGLNETEAPEHPQFAYSYIGLNYSPDWNEDHNTVIEYNARTRRYMWGGETYKTLTEAQAAVVKQFDERKAKVSGCSGSAE